MRIKGSYSNLKKYKPKKGSCHICGGKPHNDKKGFPEHITPLVIQQKLSKKQDD